MKKILAVLAILLISLAPAFADSFGTQAAWRNAYIGALNAGDYTKFDEAFQSKPLYLSPHTKQTSNGCNVPGGGPRNANENCQLLTNFSLDLLAQDVYQAYLLKKDLIETIPDQQTKDAAWDTFYRTYTPQITFQVSNTAGKDMRLARYTYIDIQHNPDPNNLPLDVRDTRRLLYVKPAKKINKSENAFTGKDELMLEWACEKGLLGTSAEAWDGAEWQWQHPGQWDMPPFSPSGGDRLYNQLGSPNVYPGNVYYVNFTLRDWMKKGYEITEYYQNDFIEISKVFISLSYSFLVRYAIDNDLTSGSYASDVVDVWYCDADKSETEVLKSKQVLPADKLKFPQGSDKKIALCYKFKPDYQDDKATVSIFNKKKGGASPNRIFVYDDYLPRPIASYGSAIYRQPKDYTVKGLPMGEHYLELRADFDNPSLSPVSVAPRDTAGKIIHFEITEPVEKVDTLLEALAAIDKKLAEGTLGEEKDARPEGMTASSPEPSPATPRPTVTPMVSPTPTPTPTTRPATSPAATPEDVPGETRQIIVAGVIRIANASNPNELFNLMADNYSKVSLYVDNVKQTTDNIALGQRSDNTTNFTITATVPKNAKETFVLIAAGAKSVDERTTFGGGKSETKSISPEPITITSIETPIVLYSTE